MVIEVSCPTCNTITPLEFEYKDMKLSDALHKIGLDSYALEGEVKCLHCKNNVRGILSIACHPMSQESTR